MVRSRNNAKMKRQHVSLSSDNIDMMSLPLLSPAGEQLI
jgi:hypothetical protein